ncbi:hypothetical protein E3Q23_00632 [Wallemia mellicola]|uniref:Phospholipid-transporting ATPase n=2 Tax=Wallemia mellicola TaxID=1708541 RepID=A0A4T0PSR6_9BASI|nr:hypothetical protein E3Q23_00632 [Wallemia mellicola]TIB93941.1 protein transporter [Wallemia mellicola]TIC13552.1 protein transporter [Wallemia mellicola]TIC14232.1 protein transporter [Wallemia mellicola]TIC30615.1 protein transporter [Wallemia mellicola]
MRDIHRISEDQQRLLSEDHRHLEADADDDDGENSSRDEETHDMDDISDSDYRRIQLNSPSKTKYSANIVKNQKYNLISFIPYVLYEQFKFFFNLYFLLVALSQFIPPLKIGFISTYIAPLAFVLCVTISKEAYDDYLRQQRDKEVNSSLYSVINPNPSASLESGDTQAIKLTPSSRIKVGDLLLLEKNQRIPADLVLLRCTDSTGTCFVRTDQLDGETDWKLRVAVPSTQSLESDSDLLHVKAEFLAGPPIKDIHTFKGSVHHHGSSIFEQALPTEPLSAENCLWANTVLAAGSAVGVVVYTGKETRAVMNTSNPKSKVGLLDWEINRLAKILCLVTFLLSVALVALNGFRGQWYIYIFRFLILFSSIIPISLRVNLDMGKTAYSKQIMKDKNIPGTVVRTSTLPEELGRISYLLSDKTGTLTQNEMIMRKLHMGTMSFSNDSMDEIRYQLATFYGAADDDDSKAPTLVTGVQLASRGRRDMSSRVKDVVMGLSLCHNVTPVSNDDGSVSYQASSPDEVAIVNWTESVGMTLVQRDRNQITLRTPSNALLKFEVLQLFPFTSESKRMSIIVRDTETGEITFYEKGADVVMIPRVQRQDWLEEETGNMAREGLRTLVMAQRILTENTYATFEKAYNEAKVNSSIGRLDVTPEEVVDKYLEHDLELLGLTGVEDKLQEDVKSTLELLRNAGLKIWMLTGDKIETATCIAISSKLVYRNQYIHQIAKAKTVEEMKDHLDFLQSKPDSCLVIDGDSLNLCLNNLKPEFIQVATQLSVVVACRCSPTQKADIAKLIRAHTKKRVCCIGDGGNDVSMIQAADVGVGIVGKEGKQASLAADFSVNQFSFLTRLLVWHGRNSYKRSAKLAQFVIHRGLIISIIQAVFSAIMYFAPIAIYQGWLMVGYSTIYTMAPVFSLVFDRDVNEELALLYPELYKELTKGRSLSFKTFFTWMMVSVYQGGAIMIMSLLLFENEFLNIVAISFTSLIVNELIMVALEITTWHLYMVIAEIVTLIIYILSMVLLPEYFDLSFVFSLRFVWKVAVIVAVSSLPLYVYKAVRSRFAPANYAKLSYL